MTYLATSRMPQVIRPIDLEPQVVKCMNHLVGHCVFKVSLVLHLVCANQNAIFRVKATTFSVRAATTVNVVVMEIAS
jgi:hypothetical protein